jgi:glyoxylase-like metal-dependent hydrolase (beta-lactamase superfamily II)
MSARGQSQNATEKQHSQIGILFAAGGLAGSLVSAQDISAQDQDLSKVQLHVTKVAGNIYMLEGEAAGNIGASVSDDVFIDDQYARLAEKIQAALKSITDKPVRFIVNTHFHGDHTGGNAYSQEQAPIIAQDHVRKTSGERRSSNGMIDGVQQVVSQLPPDVKVIPGHGPVSNLDDVPAYLGMLKETRDAVQKSFETEQDSRPDEAG